ncbi:hypothetical protein KML24007_03840 [Alistipes indistinctus]|uniref:hypothetical protein n=1 Tax=Alistipes indistinctus TaxID=626932 RepID=UPI0036F25AB3
MAIIGRGQITVHIAEQGEKGDPGESGASSYLHIRYSASSNGNPMVTTPNSYIGIAVTTSATAPTSYTSYAWSLLAGKAGSDGVPGTSSYVHIRYSANASGSPMTTTPNIYIGIAVTTSATAPTSYMAYQWGRLQGETGQPGESSHLHIRYSANSTGNPMSTTPNTYIGTAVTDSATAPTNYTAYTWQRITGMDGADGVDGTSQYIHIRYSANASGTPMTTTVNKYIGIAITNSPTAPTSYVSYTWSQFQGDTGPTGSAGTAGPGIVFRGVFSASTVYYNNTLRRDIVKYGTTYYIYKGTNASSGSWTTTNWESFGAEFTSVATTLLLADLAYIENLGVRNLVTASSGQRIEITSAKNSMAFYTAASSTTPVLEIKTTSDAIYMGQGAGFQIKQTGVNISIFKGYLHQGSEGSGISVPVLPWSQPESIGQHVILQAYTNSATGKYKTGIYIAVSGTHGTATTSDKINGIHIEEGGLFVGGDYTKLRSNNVLSGIVAAGKVSATGTLLKSWVLSFMGGYITSAKTATGKYRITFSNTSYLYGANDYSVIFMPDGPHSNGSTGAYACTMARTSSYFDVWTSDDASTNDCAFTFIVVIMNKFWSY